MNGKVELLAPAGNMECLRAALHFGADAVYLAGRQYGLRAFADNFAPDELQEAVSLAHAMGKRVYLTINALFRGEDFAGLEDSLRVAQKAGVDAVIVSDPGVLMVARDYLEVHLSTQASTMNAKSAAFWHAQGVKRVVLARELSLKEIAQIRADTPDSLELEAFVHGAMCVAYSGRCLLSSVFTGRSGNKGACAQPCRWEYTLHERGYAGEYYPIEEDERGTYVLNSKDLMMIEHLPALINAGLCSLKIEGRMKSAYYVACVVNAYRRALDAYYAQPCGSFAPDPRLVDELIDSATRQFTTGFYFGNPREQGQDVKKDYARRGYHFCGMVLRGQDARGLVLVEQRNRFFRGETLYVLSPHMGFESFEAKELFNEEGQPVESAPHPQQRLYMRCPLDLKPGDMLRVRRAQDAGAPV